MGLFSSIGKAFKSVFKGIKKVFKKVLGGIGKILNSKWGKILLLAAAIFTGGMALAGGFQAFAASSAAGNTFMANFVAGAKGFMVALANPVGQAKSMFGAGAEAAAGAAGAGVGSTAAEVGGQELAAGVAQEAVGQTAAEGAIQSAAGGIGGGGKEAIAAATGGGGGTVGAATQTAAQQAGGRAAMEGMFGTAAQEAGKQTAGQVAKGWLTKAADFGKEFIMSPAGGMMLQGAASGAAAEEKMKFDDRFRRRWMDPNNEFAQRDEQGFSIQRGGPPVFGPGGGSVGPGGPITTSGALPGEPLPAG